jgi:hypothetical protein
MVNSQYRDQKEDKKDLIKQARQEWEDIVAYLDELDQPDQETKRREHHQQEAEEAAQQELQRYLHNSYENSAD